MKSGAVTTRTEPRDVTLLHSAYMSIRELIIALTLPPGSMISDQELCDRLGLGQTPVREALRRLALEGMVHVYPRRATAVATLGVPEVREIYEARMTLEPVAAGLAAQRMTDQQMLELIALGDQLQQSSTEMNPDYLPANRVLHVKIAQFAQNRYLANDIEHIEALNHWLWNIHFALQGARRPEFEPHELAHTRLIDALRSRNSGGAEAAMREDINLSRDQLLLRF